MKKKIENRKFRMSYAELQYACSEKLNFMKRDVQKFNQFGVSEANILHLEAQMNALYNMPSDDEFLSELIQVTVTKDDVSETLRIHIRNLLLRVILTFGSDSAEIRKFNVQNISKLSDYKLMHTAGNVVRTAIPLSDALEVTGLTLDHMEEIGFQINHLENLLNEKSNLIVQRDIVTHNKLVRANELYASMTTLCKIGKNIWSSIDSTRCEDYDLMGKVAKKVVETANTDVELDNSTNASDDVNNSVVENPAA